MVVGRLQTDSFARSGTASSAYFPAVVVGTIVGRTVNRRIRVRMFQLRIGRQDQKLMYKCRMYHHLLWTLKMLILIELLDSALEIG